MPTVLFVCTANICRSPMASAIFKYKLSQEKSAHEWQVESAGTWALGGHPASEFSQQVLQERGLDISQHRSRTVTQELISGVDLVLTMEKGHKEALRAEFPEAAERIYMLSEMAGHSHDIQDPIGGTQADYQAAADEIDRLLSVGLEKIMQLAGFLST